MSLHLHRVVAVAQSCLNRLFQRRGGLSLSAAGIIGFVLGASLLGIVMGASAQQRPGVPSADELATRLGDRVVSMAAPDEPIRFGLHLPFHDLAGLDDLDQRLYTPGDPLFRHFLSSSEFNRRFAPTQEEYDALVALAQRNGLQVAERHSGRSLLTVEGPAAKVHQLFGVQMRQMQTRDGVAYQAADRAPMLPAEFAAAGVQVVGLNRRPMHAHTSQPQAQTFPGPVSHPNAITVPDNGPGGGLGPGDIQTIYNTIGLSNPGAGQTIALAELATANYADAQTYLSQFGLPASAYSNLSFVNVDGGTTSTNGDVEVILDIEMVFAMAPNVAKLIVYTAPNTGQAYVDLFTKIADDNQARTISTSWGSIEFGGDAAETAAFQKMVTQGQSLFAASGDTGAYANCASYPPLVQSPAVEPNVTGVGGTTLTLDSRTSAYISETAWASPGDYRNSSGCPDSGGGGGISQYALIPAYQQGVVSSAPAGEFSTTHRNVPDVSLNAGWTQASYAIYFGGGWGAAGGTSAGAPLWASLWALVNQALAVRGDTNGAGFANPTIYSLAENATTYAADFHDIADGSNNLYYHAVTGYDTATGWGTPRGANLVQDAVIALAGPAAPTLSATAGSSGQASLSWTASRGASSYNIYQGTTAGGEGTSPVQTVNGSTTTATVTGLSAGAPYYFTVNAVNSTSIAGPASNEASVTDVATPASISLSPTSVSFGSQAVGTTSAAQTVTVTVNGTGTVSLSLNAAGGPFAVSPSSCVLASGSCTFQVSFAPQSAGTFSNQVNVTYSGDSSTLPGAATLSLAGTGTQPALSLSPASISFGSQPVGTTGAVQTVTVQNTGNVAANITAAASGANATDLGLSGCSGTTLQTNASCTLSLSFSPGASGTRAFSVIITATDPSNSASSATQTLTVSGTGVARDPSLSLSAASVSFGNQPVGTTSSTAQVVTVTNNGNVPVTPAASLGGTSSGDFSLSDPCSGQTLAVGASCKLSLTFTPAASRARSAAVSLAFSDTYGDTTTPLILPVTGTGTQPAITLSAASLSFGNQQLGGTSAASTVTLSNSGNGTLNLTGISITGPYSQTNSCGASLAPSSSCTISVSFAPTATGAASGTLSIASDAPNSPATVSLSGTGTQPALQLSPATLSFGNQRINTTSAAQPVQLSNTGTAPLNFNLVGGISLSGPYSQGGNCGTSLAPGASCTVWVSFVPTASGAAAGTLSIASDAPNSPAVVSLSGTGTAPQLSVSAPQSFGNVPVGTVATQAVTVTNPGTAALTLSSIGVSGTDFSQSNNCPQSLAAGSSCSITLGFKPSAPGSRSGSLGVASDAGTSTQALGGTGTNSIPASFSLNPITGAEPGTLATSNTITVSGTNVPSAISITAPGQYRINSGAYTGAAGTVQPGDQVQVQLAASGSFNTPTSATLSIGGVSAAFMVTTRAPITTPNVFSFTPASGVKPGSVVTSNSVTITGIEVAVPVSVSGGSYSLNGGAFTSAAGMINPGDQVMLQLTASTDYGASSQAVLTVSGVSASFQVSTSTQLPPVTVHSSGGGAFGPWGLLGLSLLALLRRRNTRRWLKAAALPVLLLAGPSQADDLSPYYAGIRAGTLVSGPGDLGQALQNRGYSNVSAQQSTYGFSGTLYAGYEWPSGMGVELGYTDPGSRRTSLSGAAPSSLGALLTSAADLAKGMGPTVSLSLRVHYPLLQRLYFVPRIGLYYWDSRSTVSAGDQSASKSAMGMGETIGGGLSYRLFGGLEAGLGVDYFRSTPLTQFVQAAASLEWRFGT